MVELLDPRQALDADRAVTGAPSSRQIAGADLKASTYLTPIYIDDEMELAIRADFRVFLTLVWRFLLSCDPSPDQLSMAHYCQHGPDRSVIMAFRGFSKSWIVGAFALWLLWCNPQLKVLIVSGAEARAVATTNWCLQLINTMPLLRRLRPKPNQRQSAKAFDVGPALPDQSPSFHAAGIGGQIVGFRGDFILPDDVETQTNSITVGGREKTREAVKEFDSVLKPGGVIKYLGTPHDADSLYSELERRGYEIRIWPAFFPTPEEVKLYKGRLHPYITHCLRKNPALAGTPIQPGRFTPEDLAKRRLSLGRSEFALQFMLDTSLSDAGKYPLKFKDLMVMALDPKRGPDEVAWGTDKRITDLPLFGFGGDYFHEPSFTSPEFSPWSTTTGFLDPSGRGKDETGLTIVGELHGNIFVLVNRGFFGGSSPENLKAIAALCVRYNVEVLECEDNFGDGMFTQLLRPVVAAAWEKEVAERRRRGTPGGSRPGTARAGTAVENVKSSNQMHKERRILAVLEPVSQQHRLVFAREVIEADERSLASIDGEDNKRAYSLLYQYAHLTRDKDSLAHDDRLESLAGAVARYAEIIGVDQKIMARRAQEDRTAEELARLLGEEDELHGSGRAGGVRIGPENGRAASLSPCKR